MASLDSQAVDLENGLKGGFVEWALSFIFPKSLNASAVLLAETSPEGLRDNTVNVKLGETPVTVASLKSAIDSLKLPVRAVNEPENKSLNYQIAGAIQTAVNQNLKGNWGSLFDGYHGLGAEDPSLARSLKVAQSVYTNVQKAVIDGMTPLLPDGASADMKTDLERYATAIASATSGLPVGKENKPDVSNIKSATYLQGYAKHVYDKLELVDYGNKGTREYSPKDFASLGVPVFTMSAEGTQYANYFIDKLNTQLAELNQRRASVSTTLEKLGASSLPDKEKALISDLIIHGKLSSEELELVGHESEATWKTLAKAVIEVANEKTGAALPDVVLSADNSFKVGNLPVSIYFTPDKPQTTPGTSGVPIS